MKRTQRDFYRLIAELESDMMLLDELAEKNGKARERVRQSRNDELLWAALGYTIHNIYNLMENYFLRISKFFENSLDSVSWHKDLIHRMTLDIETERPALLNRSQAAAIDVLRAFRHVFRNIYQTGLDPARVELIDNQLDETIEGFKQAHTDYAAKLRGIIEKLA